MTDSTSENPKFTEVRQDGWTLTVRRQFESVPFLSLLNGKSSGPKDPAIEIIGSSRFTQVKRFTVNLDGSPVPIYSKMYLNRSVWDDQAMVPAKPGHAVVSGGIDAD